MASDSTSSARTETVKTYVSPQTKEEIEREADRRDLSMSALVARYVRRGLRQDREDLKRLSDRAHERAREQDRARRLDRDRDRERDRRGRERD